MTPALGGMARIPQWFLWRLDWDGAEGKYRKRPAALSGAVLEGEGNGASAAHNWHTYEAACAALQELPRSGAQCYTLGFWLTAESGYWFLDIDMQHCGLAPYEATEYAQGLLNAYPGAMVEWSSGTKGLHIIGRGDVAHPHWTRPHPPELRRQLKPLDLEFYTSGRGIAFGLTGVASGCADTVFDMAPLQQSLFPVKVARDSDGARAEWRGPADDDVLLQRALNAKVSAESAFGGKASFPQLWRGECELTSEADLALAAHLAFWTGCDAERIERMMLRSGLVREKWHERRGAMTYLQYTINTACDGTENIYREPERNLAVQQQLYTTLDAAAPQPGEQRISAELWDQVQGLLDQVTACGTEIDLHNTVIPAIQVAGVPGALQSRVENEVKQKLWAFGNKMPVAKLRALLFPPAMRPAGDGELPAWAQPYCFDTSRDSFFNTNNGTFMSMVGFQATYGRVMPVNDQGRRESAPERCLHFWGMPVVEQIGYRPDCGPFYEWQGVHYANLYSPSSLPAVADGYTDRGVAGINAFQSHLFDMCGRRQEVYEQLLYWMAHNVQRPGVKIRWSPILKGVNGDGKTLVTAVLRAAMGYRNVSTTSNSNISNSGGFTDWAVRGAVNIIEEIMLTGKVRHQLYNAMKEFITNNIVDINPKGAKPYQEYNTTNHWANTNHNDALPMTVDDRRWFVIFTPWASLDEMKTYCGLDAEGWKSRTDAIDHAKENCASELRRWFMGLAIPEWFDINGSAPMTPEKRRMMASSSDSAEAIAESIIATGAVGVSEAVVSSGHLSNVMQAHAHATPGMDIPKGQAMNHMLTRLGYSRVPGYIKWNGSAVIVWLKDGHNYENDKIREMLDATKVVVQPPQVVVP